ncbi:CobW family GTP-binding protein [Anaerobacillus isosaccharinicus]|uniref:GTP-binding protein n=1 Tax=Anaerobacillus isosaccharinicus TaxID=1532552 RepID=A0A1S2L980_9BACI|nr:GTP-binding protein [Anaerobacillus isosaccharinicus]MBA5585722.1 GTP-binding protein [Anaerobacillus isosaccharinicus]QOY35972.1 GTP-binding protein [Anaerobacillus isosaccharinicus]
MKKRVPAYIITGFLGSGKTTVLQNLLTYCKKNNLKPAIVLNEIGETNVEQDLFHNDQVLEMLNGCICCSIQGDFTQELHSFLTSLNEEDVPDFLFIEGTGVANPLEIVDALTDPLLIDDVDLYSIINLIDGSKYLEYHSIFSSSKEVRTVLKSQVTTSSFIILNKVDLITEKMLQKVRKKMTDLKMDDTPIVETSYGDVDIQLLLERKIRTRRTGISKGKCGCTSGHHCEDHSHQDLNHSFQAIKINVANPIDRIQFENWLKRFPDTMVRGKGIVQLTETVGMFQFQYASKQLKLNRMKEATKLDPCIILIGVDLKSKEIEASFNKTFN